MTTPKAPPAPPPDTSTLSGLLRAWQERDKRYAQRRFGGVSDREVACIRWWRYQEARDLPYPEDHPRALRTVEAWEPPAPTGAPLLRR